MEFLTLQIAECQAQELSVPILMTLQFQNINLLKEKTVPTVFSFNKTV